MTVAWVVNLETLAEVCKKAISGDSSDVEKSQPAGRSAAEALQGTRRVGRALLHDDGSGPRHEGLKALRRFRKVRRRSGKSYPSESSPRPPRPGQIHHLQAARRLLQPQRNGTATQKVSTRHSRFLRRPN